MRRTARTVLVAVGVTLLAALAVAAAGGAVSAEATASSADVDAGGPSHSASDARIAYFSMAGRGIVTDQEELVEDHPGPPYVWESESLELRPTVHTEPSNRTKMVCASLLDEDRAVIEEVGCNTWEASTRQRYPRLTMAEWPAETRGTHFVQVELLEEVPNESTDENASATDENASATERVVHDTIEVEVYVIGKQGDLSGDGLTNAREVELGTDFTRQDTSGNGLTDWEEAYQYGTDPLQADTTGDGLSDGTVARLGLPPTVPYAVHGVIALLMFAVAGVAVGGVKLRRVLGADVESPETSDDESVSAVEPVVDPDADGFPHTKEDEVLVILREHGGRMRQADLVDETEWSKATVSRLLSSLEEEGRVEKIRIGRGNVVQLTGADPGFEDGRSQASG